MSTISRPRLKAQAFTDRWQVEIVDLTGTYVRNAGMKSAAILDGAELCRVEEFAARHFRRSGFEATFVESEPFRVLFGVYFWSVIQDRCDRQVRTVGIMARPAYDQGGPSEMIWIPLPSDFGTADYSRRRAKALTKHLSAIAETRAELLRLFDSWLAPSAGLREYLGGHRRESVETARKLIELIPPAVLKTVLGYLVLHYWGHRSGWPDLLVYRPDQWFLAEIKSWRDKLNENQKRWIEDNHRYLHLPFKLVQVHRMECNVSASALEPPGPARRESGWTNAAPRRPCPRQSVAAPSRLLARLRPDWRSFGGSTTPVLAIGTSAASFGEREGFLGSRNVDHVRKAAVRDAMRHMLGKRWSCTRCGVELSAELSEASAGWCVAV